jgi:hypothetical protein
MKAPRTLDTIPSSPYSHVGTPTNAFSVSLNVDEKSTGIYEGFLQVVFKSRVPAPSPPCFPMNLLATGRLCSYLGRIVGNRLPPEPRGDGVRAKPDAGPDAEARDASGFGFLEDELTADVEDGGEFFCRQGTANLLNAVSQRYSG